MRQRIIIPALTEEVMDDHEMRRDRCETLPLKRRAYRHRPRPKTAIIAEAAKRAYQERMAKEQQLRELNGPWNNDQDLDLNE